MVGLDDLRGFPSQFQDSKWPKSPEEDPATHSSLGLRGLQVSPKCETLEDQETSHLDKGAGAFQLFWITKTISEGNFSCLEARGDSAIFMDLRLGWTCTKITSFRIYKLVWKAKL